MKHLVIIGTVFPEPTSTAAGTRMLQLISLFQEMNWKISFLSAAEKSERSFDLSQLNVATYSITLNNDDFDKLLLHLTPDAVLYDRFLTEEQFGWRVTEKLPNAITILDTEDLHFLRRSRADAFKKQIPWNKDMLFGSPTFFREMAAIYRCDISLIISDEEMNLLTETFHIPLSQLIYLPLFAKFNTETPDYEDRKDFVSIGNFLHEPNWYTVLELKRIWKNIKKEIPEAELHIYGAYPPPKAYQLHNPNEGFIIQGSTDSVEEIFKKYRVLLAPIPFGAGIKGKLLDAMQFGLPSVTSSIGAEGMQIASNDETPFWNGYICDNDDDFIRKSIDVYQNPTLWKKFQQNGKIIIDEKFRKELYFDAFKKRISKILNQIHQHRTSHYLGLLFRHHTLQSTKYLSKWIMEKNKKDI